MRPDIARDAMASNIAVPRTGCEIWCSLSNFAPTSASDLSCGSMSAIGAVKPSANTRTRIALSRLVAYRAKVHLLFSGLVKKSATSLTIRRSRAAAVMIEFLAMNLKVSGLIRKADGSIVILNNKSRKVGDVIDDAGRCKLTAIKDTALVFEFDGYEIEHELDKK